MSYLQSHVNRRHPDQFGQPAQPIIAPSQQQAPPPQQQAPPPQQQAPPPPAQPSEADRALQERLERDLGDIKERLKVTESQLVEERNARNAQQLKVHPQKINEQ